MIKEALQYLVSLKANKTYEINGSTYSDRDLVRIDPHIFRPKEIQVSSLNALAALLKTELEGQHNRPIFVKVEDHRNVRVFSGLDGYMGRDYLYHCMCDAPEFRPGWMEHEDAIIKLRSMFVQDVPNGDLPYVLDLLSRINKDSSVATSDNGLSQTVEARSGVALAQRVQVRPRVRLSPFRTFNEVHQPSSEFLLRLDDKGRVGILEADGGRWKMEARMYIAAYLHECLKDLVDEQTVVILE